MEGRAKTKENEASKCLKETKAREEARGEEEKDDWQGTEVGDRRELLLFCPVLALYVSLLRITVPPLKHFRTNFVWLVKYSRNYFYAAMRRARRSSEKRFGFTRRFDRFSMSSRIIMYRDFIS